jgi:hypothetical protein
MFFWSYKILKTTLIPLEFFFYNVWLENNLLEWNFSKFIYYFFVTFQLRAIQIQMNAELRCTWKRSPFWGFFFSDKFYEYSEDYIHLHQKVEEIDQQAKDPEDQMN